MSNKKWLTIGCGGCLSIIVIIIILIVMGGFWIKNYTNQIQQQFKTLTAEQKELENQFPFSAPEDKAIDPERYDTFLSVREKIVTETESKLDWLIQFAQSPDDKGGMTIIRLIRNFVGLPLTISEIGLFRVDLLREAEMSHKEYDYLTRVSAAEILSWREFEEGNPWRQHAETYVQPLEDIQAHIEKAEENNPGQNIETGPFDLDEFLEEIQVAKDPDHTNRELIQSKINRFLSSDTVILVDACFVQETFDQMLYTNPEQ